MIRDASICQSVNRNRARPLSLRPSLYLHRSISTQHDSKKSTGAIVLYILDCTPPPPPPHKIVMSDEPYTIWFNKQGMTLLSLKQRMTLLCLISHISYIIKWFNKSNKLRRCNRMCSRAHLLEELGSFIFSYLCSRNLVLIILLYQFGSYCFRCYFELI